MRREELIWRSCSMARPLSRSFYRRGLCHIRLSECTCQQSLLVRRAWGWGVERGVGDRFLTSSPEIFPASHEAAEMCSDACAQWNSPWFCQRIRSRLGFRGKSLPGWCQIFYALRPPMLHAHKKHKKCPSLISGKRHTWKVLSSVFLRVQSHARVWSPPVF